MLSTTCITCGTVFTRKNYEINSGRAKFCSIRCKAEFQKGKKHSEEHKRKISESEKGRKRNPLTKVTKEKVSNGLKKYYKENEVSPETRKLISEKAKKMWEDKDMTERNKKVALSKIGEKNPNWKGGVSFKRIRNDVESRLWREAVFARDNWTCQKCGERGGKLNAHHIFNFAEYPELRLAIDNGITFCDKCHKKFHKKYGTKNNTREQLEEFLKV